VVGGRVGVDADLRERAAEIVVQGAAGDRGAERR
jgi:hypothetical protein